MQVFNEQINGKNFKFKQMSVIDCLKVQQRLLRKISDIDYVINQIKSIGVESNFLEGLLPIFVTILQGFEPDELINFITEIFILAQLNTQQNDLSYIPTTLEKDFNTNFNGIFNVIFTILSKNYSSSDFFLTTPSQEVNQDTTQVIKK